MKDEEMVPKAVAEAMARLGEARVREIKMTMQAIAPVIREFIESSVDTKVAALVGRMDQIEARPSLKYMGVWDENAQFNEGDFVTDHGSLWYCKASTRSRPGMSSDWQLAVKRGRPGRDAG